MKKAVYIGAGNDIIPFIVCDMIDTFVYIDSQPISEFGLTGWDDKTMYRYSFLNDIDKVMLQNNMVLSNQTLNYLEYLEGLEYRRIKYFINTPFPEKVDTFLLKEIATSDTLIIAGYRPNSVIIKMMPCLQNIILNTHTFYGCTGDDDDDVINYLHNTSKSYRYYVMKEKIPYDYWIDDNITPDIKHNYSIIEHRCIRSI